MLNQHEWLEYGIANGFCSPPVCACHDGIPMTANEDTEWEEVGEACVFIVRPYSDPQVKADVEANHSPSVWRSDAGVPMLNEHAARADG